MFHGNYCGKGNRGGAPIDALDHACQKHDVGYHHTPDGKNRNKHDRSFVDNLKKISSNKEHPMVTRVKARVFSKYFERKLAEDAPVNSVSGGSIAGIGVGTPAFGEPGVSKKVQKKHQRNKSKLILRRKIINENMGRFAGQDTFIVPTDTFMRARMAKNHNKHWKTYIGEDEHGKRIREYANKKHKSPIILQDERSGAMCYARYGKK
jgi:hypothetical protein